MNVSEALTGISSSSKPLAVLVLVTDSPALPPTKKVALHSRDVPGAKSNGTAQLPAPSKLRVSPPTTSTRLSIVTVSTALLLVTV